MRVVELALAAGLLLLTGCDQAVGPVVAIGTLEGAGTLASCGPQKGHAYYPAAGLVPKGKDGWTDDQITGGSTTLTLSPRGDLDILFKDATGEVSSARGDGGEVYPLRASDDEVTVVVVYPSGAQAAEIYSFVHEADGRVKMLQLSSKGLSSDVAVPKAAVYVADCTTFNLPSVASTSAAAGKTYSAGEVGWGEAEGGEDPDAGGPVPQN